MYNATTIGIKIHSMRNWLIKTLIDFAIMLMEKPPVKRSSVIREYESKIEKEVRPLV